MSELLSIILDARAVPEEVAAKRLEAARTAGAAVEVMVAGAGEPAVVRNAALRACRGSHCVFQRASEPLDGEFLEQACRLLDTRTELGFVTSFADRVPAASGGEPLPVTEVSLLARPLTTALPTVFRRALWEQLGGFDEALPAGEDADLWLRALDRGIAGAVIEGRLPQGEPWAGPPAGAAAWQAFCERHRQLIARSGTTALLHKERILRELERQARVAQKQRLEIERTREQLAVLELLVANLESALNTP